MANAPQIEPTLGEPGDHYEQEADRVADQVMTIPEPQLRRQSDDEEREEEPEEEVSPNLLQRQNEGEEKKEEEEEVAPQLIQRQSVEPEEEEEPEETASPSQLQRQNAGEEEEEEKTAFPQQARPGRAPQVTPEVATHINALSGSGQALSESARAFFQPRFGHDFSHVRIHTDTRAADAAKAVNARAFTVDRDIVFGPGQYAPNSHGGQRLLAHELAHVVQQGRYHHQLSLPKRASPISSIFEEFVVQRIAPAVAAVIWFGKALAATSIDALIDFAIATITGMPPPGFWAHIGNFFINLVPGLSEAKKVKKAAKLFRVIDKILDIVKVYKKLKVPGAASLLRRMSKEADYFTGAIKAADLSKAKAALGRLLGFLREAQVTSKLVEGGAKVVHLGKSLKKGKKLISEVDIVTEEAGRLVFNQVKAGSRAILTPGSTSWAKFTRQAEATLKAASDSGAKVRYYVDDISDEARNFLTSKGIEVRKTSEFLK